MRHAQFVIGPAGAGKSTYCEALQKHCEAIKRPVHLVNLDPAADQLSYKPTIDVRDLVNLGEVMEEMGYGPNGGLVYCMEYLGDNIEWLKDELGDDDDVYYIIDCPGQVELYSHIPVMRRIVDSMNQWGFRSVVVYCMDSQFIIEPAKYISGCLACLSAMTMLELPHVSVLTKMDLIKKSKKYMEKFYEPDIIAMNAKLNESTNPKFHALNGALAQLVEDYSMVSFHPLNLTKEESIDRVLYHIDLAIQYGEDLEPTEPDDGPQDDGGDFEYMGAPGMPDGV